jgi:serine/threonine protein kinase
MGRVFRARDTVLGRDVAIKLFHTDHPDGLEPSRRLAEARVLAALDHPSLVTLYDARLDGGGDHVYLVMEFVDGPSLQRRIEQDVLEPAFVADLLVDLARGLAAVHATGVVHRDVKPSNVLLRPTRHSPSGWEAVLADFGVAHLVDAARLTTPGTVIGTAAYLAPEQVRGDPPQPASDVYALGLLSIEALTRLHPYGGGTLQETVLARLSRSPSIPDTLGPEWTSLLTAMTSLNPAERPTAAVVADRAASLTRVDESGIPDATDLDLFALLGVETAPWTPLPDAEASPAAAPAPRDARRRSAPRRRPAIRASWVGAAAVAVALIVAGHVLAFSIVPPRQQVTEIAPAPSQSAPAPQNAPPAQQVAVSGSR